MAALRLNSKTLTIDERSQIHRQSVNLLYHGASIWKQQNEIVCHKSTASDNKSSFVFPLCLQVGG
jgi:hypothetical protein